MEDFKLGSWLVGGGSSKLRSFSLSKSYSRISWVYTCVGAIASSIGGVPLLFTRGDEQITDPDDPVLALFNRPNPPTIPSFRELLLQTFTLLGIEGMLYWVFERKKGVWTRIAIKRKWQMRPVFKSGSDSELLGWVEVDKYRRQKVAYGLTEVLPISYYNPDDPFGGLAPLTAARLGIEQEYSMAAWNAAFFAQGLRNPIGIEFKRALLPKQRKDLEKSIRDYFSGIDGGQGVFMLEGDGKFCDLHLSAAKDLDFVEGKQLTREEICAVYGVPPAIVGIFRYASYANSNVQRRLFWENCLLPKMATLLDLIRMGILEQEFPGVESNWDKRGIAALQKEFKSLAAAAKSYFDMGYTKREIAFILDAPELDPPAPELEDEPDSDPDNGPIDIVPDMVTDQIITNQILNPCKTNLDIITNKADDQWFRDYGIAYEQVLMSLEFRWLDYLHRYFDNLGNALYRRITRGDIAALNPVVWAESWEGMAELLFRDTCELAAKITIAELNTSGNLDLIVHIIRNTSSKASVVDSIDIAKFFTTDEMTAFNHAISSYASKTVGISNDIIDALNRRATQELLGGMTPNQLRKAVSKIVAETYKGRSLTIARTLSGGAYNSARFSSFETLGVQMHKWINSGDSLVRDTHRREAGSAPVVLGTPFPITGCRYPLDPMGKAKEVINCISDPQQLIWTSSRQKPISTIEVGDLVLTHRGHYKPVTAVSHDREYGGPLVKVKHLGDVKAIPCTLEHRFLTDSGWKEAQHLSIGDKLSQCSYDGEYNFVKVPIKSIELFTPKSSVRLYNFAVEDDESYVIKGVVSHNCRCTTFPVKHKAPRRDRPVTIPRAPGTAPMVNLGREKTLLNLFAKMRDNPNLVRRGRNLSVPVKSIKDVEALADDLLDKDFFKALQLTDEQVKARVKNYGHLIKVDLPNLDVAGQDELRKYLLGFIDEGTLKAGKVKTVRISANSKVPTAVYNIDSKRVSLSSAMEERLSTLFNELGKGGNPARKMAPFEDLFMADLRDLAHEFGHHLHETNDELLKWSKALFAERTKKDKLTTLKGGAKVKKDKWADHYQGRMYPEEGSVGYGSEVVSMYTAEISALPWTPAMQELLKNPRIRKVWAKTVMAHLLADPDGFEAALGALRSLK